MKVLVIGNGGREHALVWKLAQSTLVTNVFCAPGNGGTTNELKCRNVDISANNISDLVRFANKESIDLTVVGPEVPLICGIVDMWPKHLLIWGPTAPAACLEGSKIFAKEAMDRYNIPTAYWSSFDFQAAAKNWLDSQCHRDCGWVVKADGLTGGKGALVCIDREATRQAIDQMSNFGAEGKSFIVEERLYGREASLFLLCGKNGQMIALETAQDYKRAGNGDTGLNTGGMGAYSPASHLTPEIIEDIIAKHRPLVVDLGFTGFLYIGIMLTKEGWKVLEYNVRMGDPETQVVLPRLESDLFEILMTMISGEEYRRELRWSEEAVVTVVMTAGGYPDYYERGDVISGSFDWPRSASPGVIVFHAGTVLDEDGKFRTNGGRVLNITGIGDSISIARDQAYREAAMFHWKGATCREDIAENA